MKGMSLSELLRPVWKQTTMETIILHCFDCYEHFKCHFQFIVIVHTCSFTACSRHCVRSVNVVAPNSGFEIYN